MHLHASAVWAATTTKSLTKDVLLRKHADALWEISLRALHHCLEYEAAGSGEFLVLADQLLIASVFSFECHLRHQALYHYQITSSTIVDQQLSHINHHKPAINTNHHKPSLAISNILFFPISRVIHHHSPLLQPVVGIRQVPRWVQCLDGYMVDGCILKSSQSQSMFSGKTNWLLPNLVSLSPGTTRHGELTCCHGDSLPKASNMLVSSVKALGIVAWSW